MRQAKTRTVQFAARHAWTAAPPGVSAAPEQRAVARSFHDLFVARYDDLRRHVAEQSQPGVAVVAVDGASGALAGAAWVAAVIDRPGALIVGRHSMTDLHLGGDDSVSLRHVAILTSPLASLRDDVRFRIVDLRTASGFEDEHGRRFEALLAEGPLFVRCGGYALFCLPTGDPTGWPSDPGDGWECIPERVYLGASPASGESWWRSWRRRLGRRWHRMHWNPTAAAADVNAVTLVHSLPGPVRVRDRLVEPDEDALGTLRISTEAGVQSLAIGPQAARDGVLIGRYQRCDVDGPTVLLSRSISRVHLLVIDIDQRLYAVDTDSTHGTWSPGDGTEVRVVSLTEGTELALAQDGALLSWTTA